MTKASVLVAQMISRIAIVQFWWIALSVFTPFCCAEPALAILSPTPSAVILSGHFELHFVAAWGEGDHVQHILAIIGGGPGVPGGYTRDLTNLQDGSGEEAASVVLHTPHHQVAAKIVLMLLDGAGNRVAFAGHEVLVSPHRPMATSCLLSYPGSGNHLVRFMIEFITLRPTLGVDYHKDITLAENHYPDGNPLLEVELHQPPASEKFHITRNYPPVHEDNRKFRQRCNGSLVLLHRSLHEAVPRFINSIRDPEEKHELWDSDSLQARLSVEVRVFLDNLLAFVDFRGPKLLVDYARLQSNSNAVAAGLTELLGASPSRLREWVRRSDQLSEQCRTAGGREWQGRRSSVRRYRATHTSSWTEEELQQLLNVSSSMAATYREEVQAAVLPSLSSLKALILRRALEPGSLA